MAKGSRPVWHRAIVYLAGTVISAVVILALYWAQAILIPVALAIFFTFLLSPLVTALQHRGLWRVPAVLLVVTLATLLVVGVGWLVTVQVKELVAELPQHMDNIKGRVRFLRDMGKDSALDRLNQVIAEINEVWNRPDEVGPIPPVEAGGPEPPVPVAPVPTGTKWFAEVSGYLSWMLELLGGAALAAVLVVFMLLKREDLRNRLIWLTGRGHLMLTTKALDDTGQRISRYLLMQLIINGSYGLALGTGLWLIGVGHAPLWGLLAALLRYVPYVGPWVAAVFPVTLSLAQDPGWVEPLLVIGYIVVLELISNNVMEPWLYGRSIGVSEVSLMVSAGFWTFLWGPIGLVLSHPLTVCLLVVGQYVPRLRFLAVLLGDEPALEPDATLFQRLAAGDLDEAADIVAKYLKEHPAEEIYDGLLIPTLGHVRRADLQDELSEEDEQFINLALRDIIDDLASSLHDLTRGDGRLTGNFSGERAFREVRRPVRIVGCPARDEWDGLSLLLLQQQLDATKWDMEVVPSILLASELIPLIEQHEPDVLCLGSLPPGGLAHTRYLCKRLRAKFPDLLIVVGRWGLSGDSGPQEEQLRGAGANEFATSLAQSLAQLHVWLPIFEEQHAAADEPTPRR